MTDLQSSLSKKMKEEKRNKVNKKSLIFTVTHISLQAPTYCVLGVILYKFLFSKVKSALCT